MDGEGNDALGVRERQARAVPLRPQRRAADERRDREERIRELDKLKEQLMHLGDGAPLDALRSEVAAAQKQVEWRARLAHVLQGQPLRREVSFRVQPDKFFSREGLDIHVTVPINLAQATLGSKIQVRTLDDKEHVIRAYELTLTGRMQEEGFDCPLLLQIAEDRNEERGLRGKELPAHTRRGRQADIVLRAHGAAVQEHFVAGGDFEVGRHRRHVDAEARGGLCRCG